MKTKHLLAAIMLPALFAACTNDEFDSISQSAETVNGRKLADNVTLSFSMKDDANTRLAYGSNGYTWQKNDTIGACLMDVITEDYNAPRMTWSQRFNLTDYIQTNYKFTRDAKGAWKTEAKLCEGNYFFCYPYNANMGVRDAYTFDVKSQTMTNTTTAALQEAYAKNNAFMGFSKVEAGSEQGESLGIDMVSVFGATGFTLKNTGTNTYKIEKIVLRGNKVISSATVNPTVCDDDTQKNNTTASGTNPAPATAGEFNVANYVDDKYDVQYNRKSGDQYNKTEALRNVLKYGDASSVEVTLAAGNVIATQKSINVIAMVAETSGNGKLTGDDAVLDIYTDKGMIRNIDLSERHTANSTGGTTTNVLTDVILESIGSGNKVEITFDDTSIDVPSELDINSSEDLAALIHWNAKVPTPITANLKKNVTITKAMYDELASSKIGVAKLKNILPAESTDNGTKQPNVTVTLAADVPAGALDRFTYSGAVVVDVKGTQTLAKSHKIESGDDANTVTIVIDGKAALNVNKDANVYAVYNYGTLNVNAKLTATTENYGAMNIAAGKEVRSLTNYGTVANKGIIVALNDNVATDRYPGTITNEGNIKLGTNTGTIINNAGEVILNNNKKVVYANNKSATKVEDNTSGSIVITNLESDGNYKVTTSGKEGAIVQQLATASTKEIDKRANTVWLTGALSVDPNKDKDGKLQDLDLRTIAIYAKSSAARIDGNGKEQTLIVKGITVGESSALVINNVEIDFGSAGEIKMEGKAKKVATLTINSNAAYTGYVTIPTGDDYNIVKDYSSVQ